MPGRPLIFEIGQNTGVGKVHEEKPLRPRRVVRSKFRDRHYGLRRRLLLGDLLSLYLALFIALHLVGTSSDPTLDSLWILLTLPAWAILFRFYQLYRRPVQTFEPTHLDDLSRLFHALVIGSLALWVFYSVAPPSQLTAQELATFFLLSIGFLVVMRRTSRALNLRKHGPERVFLVGLEADASLMNRKFVNHPEYEMVLIGAATDEVPGGSPNDQGMRYRIEQIEPLLAGNQVDHLIVRLDSEIAANGVAERLMYACFTHGVRFGAYPGPASLLLPGVRLNHIEGMGILSHEPPILSRSDRAMKRLLDIVVALTLLVISLPVMLVAAMLIRLDSKGPILFRQLRVGKDGKLFKLNKFRTMVPDAEEMVPGLMEQSTDPDWLFLEHDPRITRVGRFLRRASLDELPQLFNVLRGEMSMVGPRPLSQTDDEGLLGWERHRIDLVPGVTGYWQVLGRTSIPFREMIEIDFAYVTGWSLWLDIKILIRTVPTVLSRRGAN